MRTTIDLPDDLFRQAKARAALSGITLKELITRFVERGLRATEPEVEANRPRREPPPYVIPAGGRVLPILSNRQIEDLISGEDAEIDGVSDVSAG